METTSLNMKQKFRIATYHQDGRITYYFPDSGNAYNNLWVYLQETLGLRLQKSQGVEDGIYWFTCSVYP